MKIFYCDSISKQVLAKLLLYLPGLFRQIDKDGASAFMTCFDSLKDYDIDFKDMKASNPQYDLVFEQLGRVLEDLLYTKVF